MGWAEAADLIIKGTHGAISAKTMTCDVERLMDEAKSLSSSAFGDALIAHRQCWHPISDEKKPVSPEVDLTGFSCLALERSGSGVISAVFVLLFVRMSCFFIGTDGRRMPTDFHSVQTFRTLDDLKLNRLAGFEGFVAIHFNRRVVCKQVLGLAVFNDEAIPLGVVKPLDLTA